MSNDSVLGTTLTHMVSDGSVRCGGKLGRCTLPRQLSVYEYWQDDVEIESVESFCGRTIPDGEEYFIRHKFPACKDCVLKC